MWGGLGQVFGASRLFTTHGVTIANVVHDIVPGLSFPVIVTNFGARCWTVMLVADSTGGSRMDDGR